MDGSTIFREPSLLEFLFQESFFGHHIKSFSFKNLFWSITSRVFVSKIADGPSHREFFLQKTLAEHHIEVFLSKNLFWSITSRVFASKIVGGASHREFLCLVSCSSILFSPSHCGSMCVFSLKITFINRNL